MASGIGHFTVLDEQECRELLRTSSVARIGWESSRGPQILPVTYVMREAELVFRTAPDALLAELAEGGRVAVLVDEVDTATRTGWSVLAQGDASRGTGDDSAGPATPTPWAAGDRPLVIKVVLDRVSGRVVAAED